MNSGRDSETMQYIWQLDITLVVLPENLGQIDGPGDGLVPTLGFKRKLGRAF